LRGRIHLGTDTAIPAGRAGEHPAVAVAQHIESLGLTVSRFKTGTPPRIDGRTVDWSRVERQDGDGSDYRFSFYERGALPHQLPCWITWAGPAAKEIIQRHLHESALYGGAISARGPRYCPSVEDKIVKFPTAERHQVFLEPEGLDTHEMYVNGLSTSLPVPVQLELLRAVPGLERAKMTRPGYAIEYDYYPPTQLTPWLETKAVEHLFFAGQINGTTGYEEAAGQGTMAGVNAVRRLRGQEPVILGRDDAYIGVLVDDLVTRGVDEPYRLFTSRSEFRLLLRQDSPRPSCGSRSSGCGPRSGCSRRRMRRRSHRRRPRVSSRAPGRRSPSLIEWPRSRAAPGSRCERCLRLRGSPSSKPMMCSPQRRSRSSTRAISRASGKRRAAWRSWRRSRCLPICRTSSCRVWQRRPAKNSAAFVLRHWRKRPGFPACPRAIFTTWLSRRFVGAVALRNIPRSKWLRNDVAVFHVKLPSLRRGTPAVYLSPVAGYIV